MYIPEAVCNLTTQTCVKQPLSKRPKIVLQDKLLLNAGQKYCRMRQGEHSAILLTFIKLPVVIKTFILSIFEWLFYTGFTVPCMQRIHYFSYFLVLMSFPLVTSTVNEYKEPLSSPAHNSLPLGSKARDNTCPTVLPIPFYNKRKVL